MSDVSLFQPAPSLPPPPYPPPPVASLEQANADEAHAPSASYAYQLLQSAPDVPSVEVESQVDTAVEIVLSWGGNVLFVSHLSPARTFWVGTSSDPASPVDYVLPEEKLGCTRRPLVRVVGDQISAVVPESSAGTFEQGDETFDLSDVVAAHAMASLDVGCRELQLPFGTRVTLTIADLEVSIAHVQAGKRSARSLFGASRTSLAWFAATAAGVAALLGVTAYMVPGLSGLDDEQSAHEQVYLIQQYLNALQEKETDPPPTTGDDGEAGGEPGTGERAPDEEGKAGSTTSKAQNKKLAIEGRPDNPDPHLARERALQEAQSFGLVAMLNRGALAGPLSMYGRDTALGLDDASFEGSMFGAELGESGGLGGLGLSGIGSGGGGLAGVIGLGDIGVGTGFGSCAAGEKCDGIGGSRGRLPGAYKPKQPSVRPEGTTQVSGRLPASTIQRIVRQNFGRFRMCYQDALAKNPNLEGRVAVRFVIGREGAVSSAQNGGSSLPDSGVVSCVTRAFYGLSFPKPEGGIVTVVYPIAFHPA